MSSTFAAPARRLLCAMLAIAALAAEPAFPASPHAAELARLRMAMAYEHGEGVPRDYAKAAAMYCEAARNGDAESAYSLGWMYANGRGLARDDARAAALFAHAMLFGHDYARRMAARLAGVTPDIPDCLRPVEPPSAWGPPEPEVVVVEALPEPAPVQDPFANLPRWKQSVADLVGKLAPGYGVDTRLALSVIAVESNFDAQARSPKDARGLMQLIPETAERFNVRNPFDPRQNVRGGLAYLRFLLAYYRGDVELAAAAYNAGEKAVDRHGGVPPFAETRDYVRKVLALYRHGRHPFDARHAPQASLIVGASR